MECLDVYIDMNIKNVNYIQDIKSGLYGEGWGHTMKILLETQHVLDKIKLPQHIPRVRLTSHWMNVCIFHERLFKTPNQSEISLQIW